MERIGDIDCYAFILIEKIEATQDLDCPLYIRIQRKAETKLFTKYVSESSLYMFDANLVANINSEFTIPLRIHYLRTPPNPSNIIIVSLRINDIYKKKKYTLGKWKFDVANIPNPENPELNCSIMKADDGNICTLFFRIVVFPTSHFPNSPPKPFFSSILLTAIPELPEVKLLPTESSKQENMDPILEELLVSSFTPIVDSLPGSTIHLSDFIKNPSSFLEPPNPPSPLEIKSDNTNIKVEIQKSKNKKHRSSNMNHFLSGPKETPPTEDNILKKAYSLLILENQTLLTQICLGQARIRLSSAVYQFLIRPTTRLHDRSKELFQPFLDFSVFQIPMKQEDFDNFITPLIEGMHYLLMQPLSTPERFVLIGTLIKFGILISNEAACSTDVYLSLLEKLEKSITELMIPLTHTLVASILPSVHIEGFDFADQETSKETYAQIALFKSLAITHELPPAFIQKIISDCCSYFDTVIYNMIMENADCINYQKIQTLLNNIRTIQKLFECTSMDFSKAFEKCLKIISTSQRLISETNLLKMPASKFNRAIAERIKPPIHLPGLYTLDKLGPHVEDRSLLKIPIPQNITFTFDWLFTEGFASSWISSSYPPNKNGSN